MGLETIDWLVIAGFLLLVLGLGLSYTRQAGQNTESFFLGGRNLPWWIAGTSMVATTFAADTPLLITEIVATHGIGGNWLWWNGMIGGMLTVFFFAKLWRRANIVTDVELVELRYDGKPAAWLRGFKSLYLGVLLNAVIIAWVNLALMALLEVFFGFDDREQLLYAGLAMALVAAYSSMSGLMGVAITDFLQFAVAMVGCVVLAVVVLQAPEVGGLDGLRERLPEDTFRFFPTFGEASGAGGFALGFAAFFSFVGVQWWASWYPGAEPGGGGYVAQRMMSARTESDAIKASLLFQVAHYALRPWPWILVALAALALYPDLAPADKKLGYVMAMKDFLPPGLKGLLLAAFFAAYMSTISTQLNWGASYLVNDLYQRFVAPGASAKQLVRASRAATVAMMVAGLAMTTQVRTLEGAFQFMISCGAGLGMVLILRWYWWRVNAWSELTATLAPFVPMALLAQFAPDMASEHKLFVTVAFVTAAWLAATFATRPTPLPHLMRFYERVRPQGAWEPVRQALGAPKKPSEVPRLMAQWGAGIAAGYSCLFLIGEVLFGGWGMAALYAGVALASMAYLRQALRA
jgi:Na+/proline symporter